LESLIIWLKFKNEMQFFRLGLHIKSPVTQYFIKCPVSRYYVKNNVSQNRKKLSSLTERKTATFIL
jgi:hypothetical protein